MQKSLKSSPVIFVILLASILTIIPHISNGYPWGHSVIFNVPWHQYFSEQFLNGEIYPRWLYNYLNGYGAPVFYFYAPLPFYLFSFIDLIFGEINGDFSTLTIGHIAIFFLSGIAFYIFISQHINKYWATFASVLYIFLPYHYIDLEVRAAVGESLAYVWIPLIMTVLCNPKKTWLQLIFSGLCYAGLIFSHLPSALLAIPAIIIFSFFATKQSDWLKPIGYALFIGVSGVTVGAIYILPALLLQNTLPYDAWVTGSGSHFKLENWLLGNSHINWFGIIVYKALAVPSLFGVGAAFLYRALHLSKNQRTKSYDINWHIILASLFTLLISWILMTKISQPVWENFPILYKVQFPWRLGAIIDFCSMLLFSLSIPGIYSYLITRYPIKYSIIIPFIQAFIATTVVIIIAFMVFQKYFPQITLQTKQELGKEVYAVEYRPKWVVESQIYLPSGNTDDLSNIEIASKIHEEGIQRWESYIKPLPNLSTLRELKDNEKITLSGNHNFLPTFSIILKSPATLRMKKIYYPHWKLTDKKKQEIPIYPDPKTGLILFDLPSGNHEFTLDRKLLLPEKIGMLISLITFGILIFWIFLTYIYRKKS